MQVHSPFDQFSLLKQMIIHFWLGGGESEKNQISHCFLWNPLVKMLDYLLRLHPLHLRPARATINLYLYCSDLFCSRKPRSSMTSFVISFSEKEHSKMFLYPSKTVISNFFEKAQTLALCFRPTFCGLAYHRHSPFELVLFLAANLFYLLDHQRGWLVYCCNGLFLFLSFVSIFLIAAETIHTFESLNLADILLSLISPFWDSTARATTEELHSCRT